MTVTTRADLEHLLSAVAHRVTRRLSAVLDAESASLEQWRVLSLLSTRDGQSMSVIAANAMLPAPTLTKARRPDGRHGPGPPPQRRDGPAQGAGAPHSARARLFTGLQGLVQDEQARWDAAVAGVVDPAELGRLLAEVLAHVD